MELNKLLLTDTSDPWPIGELRQDDEAIVSIWLGDGIPFVCPDERVFFERDFKVGGEVWQVHKTDADPFPSRPHAHCIAGTDRFIGLKLHLGTRQLFRGARFIDRKMHKKPFAKLIELIRPKFPDIDLPLDG